MNIAHIFSLISLKTLWKLKKSKKKLKRKVLLINLDFLNCFHFYFSFILWLFFQLNIGSRSNFEINR